MIIKFKLFEQLDDPFGEESYSGQLPLEGFLELMKNIDYISYPIIINDNPRFINFFVNDDNYGSLHFYLTEENGTITLMCDCDDTDDDIDVEIRLKECTEIEIEEKINALIYRLGNLGLLD